MAGLVDYIEKFNGQKVLVIGDLIADEFITGCPERLSREAPVLILRHQSREIIPGGGGNAAHNIYSLGGDVNLIGIVGYDEPGRMLREYFHRKGMGVSGILIDPDRPTTVKTRIMAGGEQVVKQQIVRIDYLQDKPVNNHLEDQLLNRIEEGLKVADGILLSDYGLGIFTGRIKKEIIRLAKGMNKITAVDTRYNLLDFQGVTLATPNLEEAGRALGREIKGRQEVSAAGRELLNRLKLEYLVITQGGEGMTLFTATGREFHIPAANYTEVYDVTGAGDTVVGVILLALVAGIEVEEAVRLANYAAGIVVRKSGVAAVNPIELAEEIVED